MALRPRQLAEEIEAILKQGRFSELKRIYDDTCEPRARTAYAADALLDAAEALTQQWEAELAAPQEELAIELRREASIREDRERRIQKYQEELSRLESMVAQTEERERVEAEVLELRSQNSLKSAQLIAAIKNGGLTTEEQKQRAALHFAEHLPLDIDKARASCKTPARAWHSIGLLCCPEPESPFVPLVSKFPAIDSYLNASLAPVATENPQPSKII